MPIRLLHTKTLELHTFNNDRDRPPYAILSHRWRDGHEVLFRAVQSGADKHLEGWSKIESCCRQAIDDRLEYVWIDTCCIDKDSLSELSEAINSMFGWYRSADRCYVYLFDVDLCQQTHWKSQFRSSEWFERAWTLQELVASREAVFFDKHWKPLGSRSFLIDEVSRASGIGRAVFDAETLDLNKWSVAQRMSWASRRTATRIEDVAYSLLGIFDVNMPLLYGEGQKAFLRLQQEIIRQTHDHSIFAWSSSSGQDCENGVTGFLASSPAAFQHDGDVFGCEFDPPISYSLTNLGVQISLRLRPWAPKVYLAALNCSRNSVDQIGIFVVIPAMGEAISARAIIGGQMCASWTKEPNTLGIETISVATQIPAAVMDRLKLSIDRPCMNIVVDTSTLVEPEEASLEMAVWQKPVEALASYKRASCFHSFETARSRSGTSSRGFLIVNSLLQPETPRFGSVCILMYPLGASHISAIKLGIDAECNPVCIIADETNAETRTGALGFSHSISRMDCLPFRGNSLADKTFWQWDCLEDEGWLAPRDQVPGRPLPLRKHHSALRRGLWALKGRRDKPSFFRLPLGIDNGRDSVVVKFEIHREAEWEYHWKFSIDWNPLTYGSWIAGEIADTTSSTESLDISRTGVTGGPFS